MTQDQEKHKGKKEKPIAGSFVSTTPGQGGLFQVKKPIEPPVSQSVSETDVQQVGRAEDQQDKREEEKPQGTPLQQHHVLPADHADATPVPPMGRQASDHLAGQNAQMQIATPYGQRSNVPLKKRKEPPVAPQISQASQQHAGQIVERRTVKVTIEIYEDQRREIEAMLTERVNRLIDAGVEVDRRKYQVSVLYTELLDFALSVAKQQK